VFLCAPIMLAQQRVDPRKTHERVLCVVPMVGSGTSDDPRRPQYAPLSPTSGTAASSDGIIAFTFQISDDGNFALAEFVALSRDGSKDLFADRNPNVNESIPRASRFFSTLSRADHGVKDPVARCRCRNAQLPRTSTKRSCKVGANIRTKVRMLTLVFT